MQQITRDNHFVSQFYLKQWSDDGTNVWSYRILAPHQEMRKWDLKPISGVAFQQDLYTQRVNGKEADDFEKWMKDEFEDPTLEPIKKILNGTSLTALDMNRLVMFLAAQAVRTPSSYIEAIEEWEKTLPRILHETLTKFVHNSVQMKNEANRLSISSNNLFFEKSLSLKILDDSREGQKCIQASVVAGRELWLERQKFLLTKTAKILQQHKWSIVSPARDYEWFTSDNPVVQLNYYPDGT